jgi:hypothetical protein
VRLSWARRIVDSAPPRPENYIDFVELVNRSKAAHPDRSAIKPIQSGKSKIFIARLLTVASSRRN